MKIGVLAMQGAYIEHINILNNLGIEAIKVRYPEDLDLVDGLIMPGGESTSMRILLDKNNLFDVLKAKVTQDFPVWGTCAGLILLAEKIHKSDVSHLKLMDMTVVRNAYGRQLGSFKVDKNIPSVSDKDIPLIFIRAPYIKEVGEKVKILATHDEKIIAARQDNLLATSFHPELSDDLSFHKYFIAMVKEVIN